MAVEPLEQRTLLSAVAWDGGGDGWRWIDPLNWEVPGESDRVPAAGDDVVIDMAGGLDVYLESTTTEINSLYCTQGLWLGAATVNVATDIELSGTVTVNSSTVSGNTLTSSGTLNLLMGTLNVDVVNQGLMTANRDNNGVDGTLTNGDGATLQVFGYRTSNTPVRTGKLTVTGDLDNAGTVELTSKDLGYGYTPLVTLNVDGTLSNQIDGALDVLVGAAVAAPGVRTLNAELVNHGTMTFEMATSVPKVGADHVNDGTINAVKGTLLFDYADSVTNSGDVEITLGARFNLANVAYTQTAGVTNLLGGELQSYGTGAVIDLQGGTLTGSGTVTGPLLNAGEVAPGGPLGALDLNGDYTQTATGILALDIGGTAAGTEHDVFNVWNDAVFDGTLAIDIADGYTPALGDLFEVINYDSYLGTFADIGGAGGCMCLGLTPHYNPTDLTLEVTSDGGHITNLELSADPIAEGVPVTLTGEFTSPDTSAGTQVVISWGDGSTDTVLDLAAGVLTFAAPHTYDDGPAELPIAVTVTGHPCGPQSDDTTITVANVAPTATLSNDGPVDEGGAAVVSVADQADASAADVAAGFTYNYDFDNDGVFEITGSSSPAANVPAALLADGPGSLTVAAQIVDKDGGTTDLTTTIAIENVAPTIDAIDGPTAGVRGQTLSFTGSFSDPGVLDTHTTSWEVTDSGGQPVATGSGTTLSFVSYEADTFTVSFTVADDDGGSDSASVAVTVDALLLGPDPLDPTRTVLMVGGTAGDDAVDLKPGGEPGTIEVRLGGVLYANLGPGIDRLVIFGGDGDDDIKVHQGLAPTSTEIYGGAGDDKLRGGRGDDILVGGPGNDLLSGHDGRDLLIGGIGRDKVHGFDGDDILVGGVYVNQDSRAAVGAVMAEWSRTDLEYADRVANLSTGGGLNGDHVLNDSTVFDDGVRDMLKGKSGLDWFLANLDDDKTDANLDEILTEIEFEFVIID
ncbi:MAG: hypothetical protein JXB62_15500 [Pirellulales bacterium]|nr:hypothetical protein [Pirellulales bacterium]